MFKPRNRVPSVIRAVLFPFILLLPFSCTTTNTESAVEYVYEKTTPGNTFSLLVYNIAGIPQIVSGVHPEADIPRISPLLNRFDIALIQENFAFNDLLVRDERHPYRSEHASCHSLYCDGLEVFSFCPIKGFTRVAWKGCSGIFGQSNDCLTPKGFAFGTFELAMGIYIDVYNLHMDAGWSNFDKKARESQFLQLTQTVMEKSVGKALIIAGDFNSRYADQTDFHSIDVFMRSCAMKDASVILGYDYDRIDKIFYRGCADFSLTPEKYKVESALFTSAEGKPLSDHDAISVLFRWEKLTVTE